MSQRTSKSLILLAIVAILLGSAGPSRAAHFQQLYLFKGFPDAGNPTGNLLVGSDGVIYGTDLSGGHSGSVFSLTPPVNSAARWTESVLWSFGAVSSSDGAAPESGVIMDASGNLLGTNVSGGTFGHGTIFELTPEAGAWSESILWNFDGFDGYNAFGGLFLGVNGAVYGTTQYGGPGFNPENFGGNGTVFVLPRGGSIHVLDTFQDAGIAGSSPIAALIPAVRGSGVFGTTTSQGAHGCGASFELAPAGNGGVTQTVIHSFGAFGGDGCVPGGSLVADGNGVLYGTTRVGGAFGEEFGGYGTVFTLTPPSSPGGNWIESIIYSFAGSPADGNYPNGVVIGPGGVLYGTTGFGGSSGNGIAFALNPPVVAGDQWTETVFHHFGGGKDGADPQGLTLKSGVLYGTTREGGANLQGTVFAIVP